MNDSSEAPQLLPYRVGQLEKAVAELSRQVDHRFDRMETGITAAIDRIAYVPMAQYEGDRRTRTTWEAAQEKRMDRFDQRLALLLTVVLVVVGGAVLAVVFQRMAMGS